MMLHGLLPWVAALGAVIAAAAWSGSADSGSSPARSPVAVDPARPPGNVQRSFDLPEPRAVVGTRHGSSRAFVGAPPPMPHHFTGDRDGRMCLECHARETRISHRQQAIAPVPHAEFTQCQQCHVNGAQSQAAPFRENTFVGLDLPGKGSRAFPGAPPTIPHGTFMRDHCLSCHGPAGRQRIATPHPFRSQCQQCHVQDSLRF